MRVSLFSCCFVWWNKRSDSFVCVSWDLMASARSRRKLAVPFSGIYQHKAAGRLWYVWMVITKHFFGFILTIFMASKLELYLSGFFCFTSEWFVLLMAPTEKLRVHQRYYNSCREGLKCPHPVSRHFLSNNLGIFHSTPQGGAKGWHGTRCIIPSVALKALTSLKNWFGQI